MEAAFSQQLRAVLGSYGAHDLWRTDDHDIARRFHQLIRSTRLRSIRDVETAIGFLLKDGLVQAPEYAALFETAVSLLSFRTPKDTAILFSGQYSFFARHNMRAGTASGVRQLGQLIGQFADSTMKMESVALSRAKDKHKWVIQKTEGGRCC